jgi:hypothetical protein
MGRIRRQHDLGAFVFPLIPGFGRELHDSSLSQDRKNDPALVGEPPNLVETSRPLAGWHILTSSRLTFLD